MSPWGVAIMLASEFFEAVKLVMMQILLVDRKFGSIEGMVVIGPAAVAALAAVSLATEDVHDVLLKVGQRPELFFVASLGGVLVNLSTNVMLAATSALTLRITSLVRNVGVVFVSTLVVHDSQITGPEYLGFGLAVSGVTLYQHARRYPLADVQTIFRDFAFFLQRPCRSCKQVIRPPPCCYRDVSTSGDFLS